jgi:hypothetical protein
MPRVNRDLQRRIAARRERERRKPGGDRQYRFVSPQPELAPEDAQLDADATVHAEPAERSAPRTTVLPATAQRVPTRIAKPFSAYKAEYAYVGSDLRRVGLVVGSLLVILILLYFLLPILIH